VNTAQSAQAVLGSLAGRRWLPVFLYAGFYFLPLSQEATFPAMNELVERDMKSLTGAFVALESLTGEEAFDAACRTW
jgi:hypothetical protein